MQKNISKLNLFISMLFNFLTKAIIEHISLYKLTKHLKDTFSIRSSPNILICVCPLADTTLFEIIFVFAICP
jgi:hypothetical protein